MIDVTKVENYRGRTLSARFVSDRQELEDINVILNRALDRSKRRIDAELDGVEHEKAE